MTTTAYPNVYIDDNAERVVTTDNHFGALHSLLNEVCSMFDKSLRTLEENKEEYQKLGGEILNESNFVNFFNNKETINERNKI